MNSCEVRIHINTLSPRLGNLRVGIVNYIGEWHTHAENIPYPSKIDLKLIEQIKQDGSCCYSKIFMIIVGRNSLCVFAYTNLTPRKDYLIGGIYENLYCDK